MKTIFKNGYFTKIMKDVTKAKLLFVAYNRSYVQGSVRNADIFDVFDTEYDYDDRYRRINECISEYEDDFIEDNVEYGVDCENYNGIETIRANFNDYVDCISNMEIDLSSSECLFNDNFEIKEIDIDKFRTAKFTGDRKITAKIVFINKEDDEEEVEEEFEY
jgi:hypothetical protein